MSSEFTFPTNRTMLLLTDQQKQQRLLIERDSVRLLVVCESL
jgi:hypothetical protein